MPRHHSCFRRPRTYWRNGENVWAPWLNPRCFFRDKLTAGFTRYPANHCVCLLHSFAKANRSDEGLTLIYVFNPVVNTKLPAEFDRVRSSSIEFDRVRSSSIEFDRVRSSSTYIPTVKWRETPYSAPFSWINRTRGDGKIVTTPPPLDANIWRVVIFCQAFSDWSSDPTISQTWSFVKSHLLLCSFVRYGFTPDFPLFW